MREVVFVRQHASINMVSSFITVQRLLKSFAILVLSFGSASVFNNMQSTHLDLRTAISGRLLPDISGFRGPRVAHGPCCRSKLRNLHMVPIKAALATLPEQPLPSMSPASRPDADGRFGRFGGSYVPETLVAALTELEKSYKDIQKDASFQEEYAQLLKDYVGRPSPLYHAERLSEHFKRPDGTRAEIYFKREDLNHTGAHKINNSLGQVLLCRRMGKQRIIAETGAGQHGVATATVCAKFGLKCIVYMGKKDMERQQLNVFRMRLLGAEVREVAAGTATLKDATSEAIRDWVTNVENTHYILGSAAGPHPYPMMVRDFQAIIGRETKVQCRDAFGGLPDVLLACVGGGSNAIGMFHDFVEDESVRLVGVEASGHGLDTEKHAATLTKGTPGVLHGSFSFLLQDSEGQIIDPHSISAGLDYPGIGPEHSFFKECGRAEYAAATDAEALEAFRLVSRTEGIIPALETSHAFSYLEELTKSVKPGANIVVCCSGRGDKDVNTAMNYFDEAGNIRRDLSSLT